MEDDTPQIITPNEPETDNGSSTFLNNNENSFVTYQSPSKEYNNQEKVQLRQCNQRLEQYFLSQKEKDQKIIDLKNKLENRRVSIAIETENITKTAQIALFQIRKERDSLETKLNDTISENEKLTIEIKSIDLKYKTEQKSLNESQNKLNILLKERDKDSIIINKLNCLVQKNKRENEKLVQEKDILKISNEELREQRDKLLKSEQELQAYKEKNTSDLNLLESHYIRVIEDNKEEISQYRNKLIDYEDRIREEFKKKYQEDFENSVKNYHQEKTQVINDIKSAHEQKIEVLRYNLEISNKEVEEKKNYIESLNVKFLEKEENIKFIMEENKLHLEKIEDLKKRNRALAIKPIRERKHYTHMLKLLKQAYIQKETEFDKLLNDKMELKVGIQKYCLLLDKEQIGSVKRQRNDDSIISDILSENKDENNQSNKENSTKRCKVERRSSGRPEGFVGKKCPLTCSGNKDKISIHNKSDMELNLSGWYLKPSNSKEKFMFPDSIGSDEHFLVYPTADDAKKDEFSGIKRVWNNKVFKKKKMKINVHDGEGIFVTSFVL